MLERLPPKYEQVIGNRRRKASLNLVSSSWSGSIGLVLGAFALLGLAAVLFFFNPAQSGFYPFCVFHRTTGLLCPGCGSLRALHQLLHQRICTSAVWRQNGQSPLLRAAQLLVQVLHLHHGNECFNLKVPEEKETRVQSR